VKTLELSVYNRKITIEEMAKIIDHTNLRPYAKKEEIKKLCDEAIEYNFGAVCVNSSYVLYAYNILKNTEIKIAAVVGFPLGACTSETKAFETKNAIELGAEEIDMVLNVGFFRDGEYDFIKNDIQQVVSAAGGAKVKVILETGFLTDEQIVKACDISKQAGAHYVKTSTGFGPMGAYYDHVYLMKQTVGNELGIKAAGGIRDAQKAVLLVNAGATRIGASASVNIIKTLKDELEKGTWFEDKNIPDNELYSWGAADPKKQPKEVYDYYIQKKEKHFDTK